MADVYEDEVSGNAVVLPVITEWVSYTPTYVGFGTVTTLVAEWRRVGSSMEIRGRFTIGSPTAVVGEIGLPAGYVQATRAANVPYGAMWSDTAANNSPYTLFGGSEIGTYPSSMRFGRLQAALTALTGNALASTSSLGFECTVPIAAWAGSANVAYGAGLATSVKAGLSSYEDKGTVTLTASGAFTGSFVVTYSRVGKSVTLNLPRISATTTAATFITLTGLPADLTPATDVLTPWMVQNSGTIQLSPGRLDVLSSNSQIRIYNTLQAGTFNNAALGGGFEASVSYVVA